MEKLQLEAKRRVKNDLRKLPKQTFNSVIKIIESLPQNPFPAGKKVKAIKGAKKVWRYRIGDYRLIYEVKAKTITILAIIHRRELEKFL